MKIVVLAGGISTERDVSLSSGKMVYDALRKKGHQCIFLDVYIGYTKDVLHIFEEDIDWMRDVETVGIAYPDIESIKKTRQDGDTNYFGPNVLSICQQADVVFMALHGENGENGKIQATFDLHGITYTGTDYLSSALAMNKNIAKELFIQYHIPTPQGICLKKEEEIPNEFPLPCVVKSNSGGSSIGVSIATTKEEYLKAIREGFLYDNQIIIEQYIKGREFSVGILENKALPIIEIAPIQGFYDYKNKYQAGNAIETCPANLSEEKTKEMQNYALDVFKALRLQNYARVDFMMNEREEIFCLEANTLPGMTKTSLLPQEAAVAGISFEDLCEKIIEGAL